MTDCPASMRRAASWMLRRAAAAFCRSMKMKRPARIAQPKSGMRESCFLAMKRNRTGNPTNIAQMSTIEAWFGHEHVRPPRIERHPHVDLELTPGTPSRTRDQRRARASTESPVLSKIPSRTASTDPSRVAATKDGRANTARIT